MINKAFLFGGGLTVTPFRSLCTCSFILGCSSGPLVPQGVDNDDPSASEGYFIGTDGAYSTRLALRRVTDPGGTPSISSDLSIIVPTTSDPIEQVALGSTARLDSLDNRLFGAAIHKNKITGASTLWTAHNIEVNTNGVGAAGGGRNGSRWYEIANLTSVPSLRQAGTLFDSAASNPNGYWIPSVAMSGQGHMALASSSASVNNYAMITVAGRLSGDALGTTQPGQLAQVSFTAYNLESHDPQRWGDYSQVSVDPSDDMTMWTFQEYCNAVDSWGVQAIQLLAPPPATPVGAAPSTIAAGQASVIVTITGDSSGGAGFFDPGADTGGPGFAKHLTASVTGGVAVNSVTFSSPTRIVLSLNTTAASSGAKNVTVTNPDGRARTGVGILTIGPPTLTNTPTRTPTSGGATNTPTPTPTSTPLVTQPPGCTGTSSSEGFEAVPWACLRPLSRPVCLGAVDGMLLLAHRTLVCIRHSRRTLRLPAISNWRSSALLRCPVRG